MGHTALFCWIAAKKPIRINKTQRISVDVSVWIGAAAEPDWIFGDEPSPGRIIVPGPVVVQPRPVVLASGILEGIVVRRAGGGSVAVGIVAIACLDSPGAVGHRHR